ncbi:hypothetical protein JT06_01315 [Desulfobulbus sp. Tol-SR]|nr:hypothetical protein JT06_01315 [Desulfobulbus sp. Tol-SR]
MSEMWNKIVEWFDSTHLVEQVTEVDYVGLFTNPWFLVPFCILMAYLVYRQSWKDLIIITILLAVWWVSGTEYMKSLIVDGELQISKILPVAFGGAVILGFVIYLFFGRSD